MVYIGESKDIPNRWVQHLKELVLNKHHNYKLQNDFNEYGIENFKFQVLETFNISPKRNNGFDLELTLLTREYLYIKQCDSINNGYNIENSLIKVIHDHMNPVHRQIKMTKQEEEMVKQFFDTHPNIFKLDLKRMKTFKRVSYNKN